MSSTDGGTAWSYEERRTWIYLVTSAGGYAVYLAIVLGRAAQTPVAHVSYIPSLLWTAVAAMTAATISSTVVETARPSESRRADVRDKEIYRFGEFVGRWCVIAGAGAGLLMAMARWQYFWIANVIYLGFVLWAVTGSAVKIAAYRRGLQAR